MRVVHVIGGLDPSHGGPSYSVPRLVEALRVEGCDASIVTVGDQVSGVRPGIEEFQQDFRELPLLGAMRFSTGLKTALLAHAEQASIIHNHGLWLMPNVAAGSIARRKTRPLIVSPRGMLDEAALRFSALRKRIFWSLLQERAFAKVAVWHATSEDEAGHIRAFGGTGAVAVIPNGVDVPDGIAAHSEDAPRRTLLFLSRLHPKKGIVSLLHAWAGIAAKRPDWDLVIAGPDEGGHRAELEARIARLGAQRVKFAGSVYGSEKDALLASADLFVLPTKSENFGIAVAEALAMGVPAIVTKGAPWSCLNHERCGWWIDHGVEALQAALTYATGLHPTERRAMGRRGRELMIRDFSWSAVASQMLELYSWTVSGEDKPSFVQ